MPKYKMKQIKQKIRKVKKLVNSFKKKVKFAGNKSTKNKRGELKVPKLEKLKDNLKKQINRQISNMSRQHQLRSNKNINRNLEMIRNQININHIKKVDNHNESNNNMMIEDDLKNDDFSRNKNYVRGINLRNVKHTTKMLDNIIENSDILLVVLDARDPMGCRCFSLEKKFIMENPDKKIIMVLNKIDLVPLNIARKWKDVLSREFPTVLFKANLQKQNKNLGTTNLYTKSVLDRPELADKLISSSKAVGSGKLLELIKNYSKKNGKKCAVTVGIIGFPNVGKSSLINSMTKSKTASVSNQPGHTKHIKYIQIDSQVTILDCPGVFFSGEDEITLLLRNTIKVEDVQDYQKAVEVIVERVDKEELLKLYSISDFYGYKEFLVNLANAKGKFKKKGILDLEATARILIQDWNRGKLKYYVPPPIEEDFQQTVVFNQGVFM